MKSATDGLQEGGSHAAVTVKRPAVTAVSLALRGRAELIFAASGSETM